jgi:hypothetical protein
MVRKYLHFEYLQRSDMEFPFATIRVATGLINEERYMYARQNL